MTVSLVLLVVAWLLVILYFVLRPRNVDLLAACVVAILAAVTLGQFKL